VGFWVKLSSSAAHILALAGVPTVALQRMVNVNRDQRPGRSSAYLKAGR